MYKLKILLSVFSILILLFVTQQVSSFDFDGENFNFFESTTTSTSGNSTTNYYNNTYYTINGTGITNISQANDTSFTSTETGNFIVYNAISKIWENEFLNTVLINLQGWLYFTGDNEVSFNETKLNKSIDARAGSGDNSSWNESLANNLYVNVNGDNMSGNLNMTNNNITQVGDIYINGKIKQDNYYIEKLNGNDIFGNNELMVVSMNNSESGGFFKQFTLQPGAPAFANIMGGSFMLVQRNYTMLSNDTQFNNCTLWQEVYDKPQDVRNFVVDCNSEDGFGDIIVGDLKIYDDLIMYDEQGEIKSVQRSLTRFDNILSGNVLGNIETELNDTTLTLINADAGIDNAIEVNLEGVVYNLSANISQELLIGTNSSPENQYATFYNGASGVGFYIENTYPSTAHADIGQFVVGEEGNIYSFFYNPYKDTKFFYDVREASDNQFENYVSGFGVSASASGINFTSGKMINGLTEVEGTNSMKSKTDGFYWVRNDGSFVQCTSFDNACFNQYNDGGSLTGNYYINVVMVVVTDSLNTTRLVAIPQNTPDATYNNLAEALADDGATISYTVNNPLINNHDLILVRIIVNKNGVLQATFGSEYYRSLIGIPIAGASGGGTNDHSLLTNLNWASAGHTFDTNLSVSGFDVVANKFYGLFNWTVNIVSPYLFGSSFDGSTLTLSFNETKLNETIDARAGGGDNASWNESYARDIFLENDTNLELGDNNITTTGTGFFGFLGSLTNRITNIFSNNANITNIYSENINVTNDVNQNRSCFGNSTDSCKGQIYYNGTHMVFQVN